MGVGIPPCSGRCRPFLADAARESVTGLYDELRGFAGGAGGVRFFRAKS